jgi:hypothetical protein
MKKTRLYKLNKFLGQTITGEKCPEIRWSDIVRVEAFGTEAVSAFAIMVTFHYSDGSDVSVHLEQKGYYDIIESLDQRFPSISPEWFDEMQTAGKDWPDVDRVLYLVEKEKLSK